MVGESLVLFIVCVKYWSASMMAYVHYLITIGAHAQQGLQYLVCACVYLSDALFLRNSTIILSTNSYSNVYTMTF